MNDGSKRPVLRRNRAWALLCLIAFSPLAGCDCDSRLPVVPIVLPPLSEVVVTPGDDTLRVGETARFTAVAYDTLGQPVMGAGFLWRSGATEIFSAGPGGQVTALAEGVDTVYATAADGTSGFATVFVYRDTGWVIQQSTVSRNLYGVHFLPDGRSGWAVGASGAVVHTADAGDHWSKQVSGTPNNLNGVWFTGENEGWAVGDIGTVLHTSNGGASWVRLNGFSSGDNLTDVCFLTEFTGYICGSNGVVYRTFDGGGSWLKTNLTPQTLRGISVADGRFGWVVGDVGVIIGTDDAGETWSLDGDVTTQPFKSVWTFDRTAAWAVGNQGLVARLEEGAPGVYGWALRNAGALNQLEGVCFPHPQTGYAVGYNGAGVVLRTDDGATTWAVQTSRSSRRLNDVYFVDTMRGWAVGDAGEIIHTARGGRQ